MNFELSHKCQLVQRLSIATKTLNKKINDFEFGKRHCYIGQLFFSISFSFDDSETDIFTNDRCNAVRYDLSESDVSIIYRPITAIDYNIYNIVFLCKIPLLYHSFCRWCINFEQPCFWMVEHICCRTWKCQKRALHIICKISDFTYVNQNLVN